MLPWIASSASGDASHRFIHSTVSPQAHSAVFNRKKLAMRWHCLQHVPFERPGQLAIWAADRGHILSVTDLWDDRSPLPGATEYDGLFILGGPMNVYEDSRYAWLANEKKFIAEAVATNKPILGICLGAQLLSVVLGGEVTKAEQKEIGWFPIQLTTASARSPLFRDFASPLVAFHWHGDRFSIPPGATHIATSAACAEQAFVSNDRVVGLQFHLEVEASSIAALIENCREELVDGRYIQAASAMLNCAQWLPAAHEQLFKLLDRLASST